jgi:hypothetical protein
MVALSFSAATLANPLLRFIDDIFGLEHCSFGPALLLVSSELAHNRFQLQSSGTNFITDFSFKLHRRRKEDRYHYQK